ncbi:MAG: CheR family methyltransferase [Coriobacteriia bacterium]
MEEQPAMVRGNLNRLLEKVHAERGLDLHQFRRRYVERRIAVRLNHLGFTTYSQYSTFLDAHPEEYLKLLDALTINVTQFFRDPSVYKVVRDEVVPAVLKAKLDRRQRLVRVWSAGCATGEEPYSLAMAFLDGMLRLGAAETVLSVVGTDIDRDALAFAKRGEFPIRELAHIPHSDRIRYIEVHGDHFRFKPEIARAVRFQYLNLFADTPIHGIDVIFCRNVFIYFNRQDQERIIGAFRQSLVRGGFLVLGRSERLSTAMSRDFELVSARERVYRKPMNLL